MPESLIASWPDQGGTWNCFSDGTLTWDSVDDQQSHEYLLLMVRRLGEDHVQEAILVTALLALTRALIAGEVVIAPGSGHGADDVAGDASTTEARD